MLTEVGTIIRIEPEAVWVETLQKSTCGSCHAKSGCGQHVLGKALSTSSSIRVLLKGKSPEQFSLNQQVTIGIPEDVVVRGSLIIYLVPLLSLLFFANVGYALAASDAVSILFGAVGLVAGGAMVRWHAWKTRNDPRLQPVIFDTVSVSS